MLIMDLSVAGLRLRAIRKAQGKTQHEVAAAAQISVRSYAGLERGTSNVNINTMLKVCQALSISPNDVFLDNPKLR